MDKITDKPEYRTWANIKTRCYNSRHNRYPYYGAKGIRMCPEWKASFKAFYEDMGNRPTPSHWIDRIDPYGDYEKSNCRWILPKYQGKNKRFLGAGRKYIRISCKEYFKITKNMLNYLNQAKKGTILKANLKKLLQLLD